MRCMLALVALVAVASGAGADPAVCRDTVVAEAARYTQSVTKAIASCQRHHVPDCDADARTTAAVARAAARLQAAVAQRC